MEKPKIEYAARTAFTEDRAANAANMIPAHIRATVERLNTEFRAEVQSGDEDEELPVAPRVLRYRL